MDQNIKFENIKAQASSWSLQGDADMLECLVKLSQVDFYIFLILDSCMDKQYFFRT